MVRPIILPPVQPMPGDELLSVNNCSHELNNTNNTSTHTHTTTVTAPRAQQQPQKLRLDLHPSSSSSDRKNSSSTCTSRFSHNPYSASPLVQPTNNNYNNGSFSSSPTHISPRGTTFRHDPYSSVVITSSSSSSTSSAAPSSSSASSAASDAEVECCHHDDLLLVDADNNNNALSAVFLVTVRFRRTQSYYVADGRVCPEATDGIAMGRYVVVEGLDRGVDIGRVDAIETLPVCDALPNVEAHAQDAILRIGGAPLLASMPTRTESVNPSSSSSSSSSSSTTIPGMNTSFVPRHKVRTVTPIEFPSSSSSHMFITLLSPVSHVRTVELTPEMRRLRLDPHERLCEPNSLVGVGDAPSKAVGALRSYTNPTHSDAALAAAYDEERREVQEPEHDVRRKAQAAADVLKRSKYAIVFAGAGISTSANIPDFRGPEGIWTTLDKTGTRKGKSLEMDKARPTFAHCAITELARRGILKYVITTNMDGLQPRSGLPRQLIEELHGCVYKEFCPGCRTSYLRGTAVKSGPMSTHLTGNTCEWCGCGLMDTIVHFAETYRDPTEEVVAGYHARRADAALVLGTSMAVQPAVTYPLKVLNHDQGKDNIIMCNMQATPSDAAASVRVYGKTDAFMFELVRALGIDPASIDTTFDAREEWVEMEALHSKHLAQRKKK
eukprot:PhM_4_TR1282/c0_g2_i1/m.7415/K11416/SIRT6, SIR2L6; mono-ADP-ribosyltransferase sirtuin 6